MKYVTLADDGETITSVSVGSMPPPGAIAVDTALPPSELSKCLFSVISEPVIETSTGENGELIETQVMVERCLLTPRPALPDPIRVDNQITASGIPVDSTIHLYDRLGKEALLSMQAPTDGYVLDVLLPDIGSYALYVNPPHPTLPMEYLIEVLA